MRYDQIADVQIGRSTLIDGWGIHRTPGRGWIWNIHGFRCVELDLHDGSRLRIGTDEPELEQLQRVSWKTVLEVVFVVFAAYTMIGELADVGFDTIIETLTDARWGIVLIALILVAATNYTDATGLAAPASPCASSQSVARSASARRSSSTSPSRCSPA